MLTGVGGRSRARDIAGPAGAAGREAARLRDGGGRVAAQLRRRDQVGPAQAADGGGGGAGHVHSERTGGGRAGQDVHDAGAGHPEKHTRHTQTADQQRRRRRGRRRATAAAAERFGTKQRRRRHARRFEAKLRYYRELNAAVFVVRLSLSRCDRPPVLSRD